MMTNATGVSLILAACMAVPAISQADATTFLVPADGKSKATFVSDAPLETMVGKSSRVSGSLTVDPADITKTTGSFKVPVVSLRTDNDLRDEHLQGDGWLDAKKTPNIHFEITEVILGKKDSPELKSGKDRKVQVKGKFTAHGVSKPVTAKGTVNWSGKQLRIKADFIVVLEDHNVSVPSIVRLKVANDIAVSVDLRAVAE
ncbi:MAG: YceI family protein [Deltaproteobacteria bacterium]|nr:YceI family protein [Deltaproteobacteria bacterium]